jgi:hypothetical protein
VGFGGKELFGIMTYFSKSLSVALICPNDESLHTCDLLGFLRDSVTNDESLHTCDLLGFLRDSVTNDESLHMCDLLGFLRDSVT